MAETTYTAKDITVLEGLEPVRLRPGMYIGSTGPRGLHHLVYEGLDNSVDEALAGRNARIDVTLHPDNSVTVVDHGSRLPAATIAPQRPPARRARCAISCCRSTRPRTACQTPSSNSRVRTTRRSSTPTCSGTRSRSNPSHRSRTTSIRTRAVRTFPASTQR